jgi:hypothetical protein
MPVQSRPLLTACSDKGTIVTPTGDLSLDCFVDADFAGLHGCDPDHSDTSAKPRTGYIITLGGCPILWKSQLQTEISLSTLESEYSALSASMRTLLPLCDLLGEICKELTMPPDFKSTIRCRVFEDNNGALLLATKQRITNRTKYFLVKWHFFWHHVCNGDVEVLKDCHHGSVGRLPYQGPQPRSFCWVDCRVSPLVLQAHLFLHVLHPHDTITNLFLVSLNERESQGTAANGCCSTVIDVGILS